MEKVVQEPTRSLPVTGEFDVVVAGGGIAGVAAAVAAARNGRSVCLLEKTFTLGGLATLGNVIVWLPLCDGMGRQVMAGLPEELLKLSVRDLRQNNESAHFQGIPPCWKPGGDPEERKRIRYQVEFNPASYLLALEKLVIRTGIRLLYDTRVCAADVDEACVRHLIVENKDGRSAIACRTVIDATGDADVCFLAGEPTESLDSNVLSGWFYYLGDRGLHLDQASHFYSPIAGRDGAEGPFFRGDSAEELTAQVLGSRELIRRRLTALRTGNPPGDIQPVAPPTIPCVRMTRRLINEFSLEERHKHQWFDDAVGFTGDWRQAGPVYAIPLRTLRGVRMRNLLVAGRCISVDKSVWDVTRAIPPCVLTGEAAGTAAAVALELTDGSLDALPADALQDRLKRQGVLLGPTLVQPAEGDRQ